MKTFTIKAFFITFIAFFSQIAMANGYCDSRESPQERQRCYNNLNSMGGLNAVDLQFNTAMKYMRINLREINNSPNVPQKQKQFIRTNQREWEENVDSICKTKACMLKHIAPRNDDLAKFYYKYNPK